jgi:hypothetical protein
MQAQIAELEALVEETQREIATLSASRIAATTELGYQENLLAEYRSEHRALQQDYADLQLVPAQSVHEVGISEAAPAQRGQTTSTSASAFPLPPIERSPAGV